MKSVFLTCHYPDQAAALTGQPVSVQLRQDVPASDTWDLTELFESLTQWEQTRKEVEKQIEGLACFQGRLLSSPRILTEALELDLELTQKVQRLYVYAQLESDQDLSNSEAQGRLGQMIGLSARLSAASSFFAPEIQALSPEMEKTWLADDRLKPYLFYLKKILRFRPHTRSSEVEEVMALSSEVGTGPGRIQEQMTNVDFDFGSVADESGSLVKLTQGNFIRFQQSFDRRVRQESFLALYQEYHRHRHALSASLGAAGGFDWFQARVRGFKTCRAAALFGDKVSEQVYDSLITQIRSGLEPLHRYLRYRCRKLGLEQLLPWDNYVPLKQLSSFRMDYDEAREVCLSALSPLGEDYVSRLRQGLTQGWVDRYENQGKRSGAYCLAAYQAHPYILLNYDPASITSLFTLIHEAGHAMHSYYSSERQPFHYHSYSIFAAEVASTFNEILLARYLREKYSHDPEMKIYLLSRQIDDIRATLYRQTMFAEFERDSHKLLESGQGITLAKLEEIYRELLGAYFGSAMELGDLLPLEFLRIPHFYHAFYVYKYATGLGAALALSGSVLAGKPGAVRRYREFLSQGGSKFPLESLKEAGVDMACPEPIREAVEIFSGLVDELIDLSE